MRLMVPNGLKNIIKRRITDNTKAKLNKYDERAKKIKTEQHKLHKKL